MKKLLAVTVIVLLCIAASNLLDASFHPAWDNDWQMYMGGEEIDGPFGFLMGALMAGGGLLIAAVVLVCVAAFIGVLFAGLGIMAVAGFAILAALLVVALGAALSPLLVPVALVVGLCWFFNRRNKRRATVKEAAV
ncbi:hypothetical protein IP91_04703 [Pseudoduganella lurida]|uniref:Uncharacterized protein n=1 Tax=Pseudoduganella lurida TaxID=1036180 RepID=A0A562QYA5_9BURK|nr:hypothetical protein [Pseudoduganella lurida]TWI61116.1 hypothetical protein IP91_04703 [Pseudoduganella lurida]